MEGAISNTGFTGVELRGGWFGRRVVGCLGGDGHPAAVVLTSGHDVRELLRSWLVSSPFDQQNYQDVDGKSRNWGNIYSCV